MLQSYALAAGLLYLMATACAAGQVSSWTSERSRLTARPKPLLSNRELAGNCAGLTVTIRTRIERLRGLQDKTKQQQWPPPTLMALWEKRPPVADIARERERVAQLNAALDAKGCKTVDVDDELRRAPVPGSAPKTK